MRPELPVLIKARAKIADPWNWGKGRRGGQRDMHTCCAAEAIEEAGKQLMLRATAYVHRQMAALTALRNAIPDGENGAIIDWNDAPERTHAEVLAAFDQAIKAAT